MVATASDFETAWIGVQPQVLAFCIRSVGDYHHAQDIVQRVAIRAWRGYATFRGDASFLTWVLTIARREIIRAARPRVEKPFDDDTPEPPDPEPPPGEGGAEDTAWIDVAVRRAVEAGDLNEAESRVLLARLNAPTDADWETIASALGLSANVCAVTHCRAIPKLRVHLFIHWQDRLGGQAAIATAYRVALDDSAEPLEPDEAEAFRRIVLERDGRYRRVGWRLALRAAAEKVARRLGLP